MIRKFFFALSTLVPLVAWPLNTEQKILLDARVDRFLTPWPAYSNTITSISMKGTWVSPRLDASINFSVSDDPTWPFAGNIEKLLYSVSQDLRVGRLEASPSLIPELSTHDELNQKICATPLECVEGGPIGVHWGEPALRLSLSLLNLPNLSSTPSLDNEGRATHANRWSLPPYSQVQSGDEVFALRNGLHYPQGVAFLFMPGLRLHYEIESPTWGHFSITHALEVSHSPIVESRHQVVLTATQAHSDGEAQLHNKIDLRFPYQQVHSLQYTTEQGRMTFEQELSYAQNFESTQRGSFASRARYEFDALSLGLSTGLVVASVADPFVGSEITYRIHSWKVSLPFEYFMKTKRRALHLAPELSFSFGKPTKGLRSNSLYARADFIKADESAPFWGAIRGNDRVLLGWVYAY